MSTVDGNVFFVHNSDRTSQHYVVYRRNFNYPHACVYRVHYFIFWARGAAVSELVMYCIDAPRSIVTKSLHRIALPFSILSGSTQKVYSVNPREEYIFLNFTR